MDVTKREVIGVALGAAVTACAPITSTSRSENKVMYGLIGKMKAVQGEREALAEILIQGLHEMPGNISYIVAKDLVDPDILWITEVWADSESHVASLRLPSVQAAIGKGRPLIAGMERVAETAPFGGPGLGQV